MMENRFINRVDNGLKVTISPGGGREREVDKDVDEEQLRTLWCGGVSDQCGEEILFELFLNAGPLVKVTIPKDRETKKQKNYAFIVFQHEESVQFAYDLLNGTELFRQKIRLQNKTTGLGLEPPSRGMHQRSYSASTPPSHHGQYGQFGGQGQGQRGFRQQDRGFMTPDLKRNNFSSPPFFNNGYQGNYGNNRSGGSGERFSDMHDRRDRDRESHSSNRESWGDSRRDNHSSNRESWGDSRRDNQNNFRDRSQDGRYRR